MKFILNVATYDYDSRVHIVPIPINTTSLTYNVAINDDDLYEMNETFKLQIIATSLHQKIKRPQPYVTTVTIIDDDERELFV